MKLGDPSQLCTTILTASYRLHLYIKIFNNVLWDYMKGCY